MNSILYVCSTRKDILDISFMFNCAYILWYQVLRLSGFSVFYRVVCLSVFPDFNCEIVEKLIKQDAKKNKYIFQGAH